MGAGVCDGTPKAPVFLQLRDCGGLREVEVTACLVWKDWPHRVHPHSLVGKTAQTASAGCGSGLMSALGTGT